MLQDLITQKQAIEAQIAEAQAVERQTALDTIQGLMKAHGINKVTLTGEAKVRKVAAKYQDPVSGKLWSGRGVSPKWFDLATVIRLDQPEAVE